MKKIFLLLLSALLLSSCAATNRYTVGVDAINTQRHNKYRKYYLSPAVEGVSEDDIQFQEYATYVHRVLKMHGFKPTKRIDNAEILVLFNYSVGKGEDHYYTYATPTWGQTGYSSSSTYGTVSSYGNFGSYNSTTTYTPKYGITGYRTNLGSYTTRLKGVSLVAGDLVEYRKTKKIVQLWTITIGNNNGDSDLRKMMPIMLAAASPYVSKNTGKVIYTEIEENDPKVDAVMGIIRKKSE